MDNVVKEWLSISEYDLETAEAMFRSERYLYVAFMCQQSIEKILKALYSQREAKLPPRTHNPLYLADIMKLDLSKYENILARLNQFYLGSRYPDERAELAKAMTKSKAEEILSKTKEVWNCLKQMLI